MVVDKSALPEAVSKAIEEAEKEEPIVLPAWDPMGALA